MAQDFGRRPDGRIAKIYLPMSLDASAKLMRTLSRLFPGCVARVGGDWTDVDVFYGDSPIPVPSRDRTDTS